ncbi:MAG: Trm112 family protein [Planctomycetes bacterium]|nr:Trm112 family protein [Planctomycetota bacterium]
MTAPLDAELLRILVCPVTRSPLRPEGDELVASIGGLRYPVRDGIPVLLPDEATLPAGFANLAAFKRQFAAEIPD